MGSSHNRVEPRSREGDERGVHAGLSKQPGPEPTVREVAWSAGGTKLRRGLRLRAHPRRALLWKGGGGEGCGWTCCCICGGNCVVQARRESAHLWA